MFVKIDTRPDFRILRPEISKLHENMTDEVRKVIRENMNTLPNHLILEMDEVSVWEPRLVEMLLEMQSFAHTKGYSFFISGVRDSSGITDSNNLNIAPTLVEAIDMVMMEKLERELSGG